MPCFEVASASMLTIYGTAAACVWLCRLYLCCFAGVRPVLIVSVPFRGCLTTSKQGKIKFPEDGLDRLKHVGDVGSILTK